MTKISNRGRIAPFMAMDVMRRANALQAQGRSVLHLEAGQPGTPAPNGVLAAAEAAIADHPIGYTDAFGTLRLRERIARHYDERYDVTVPPSRIAITGGSSGGFLLSFLSAFDVGDRFALASPSYPAYRNILSALGIEAVVLESGPEHRFQPTVELLEGLDRPIDGLIVASPSNPTGTMLDRESLSTLMEWCAQRGVRFVSDEIYHGIQYGEAPTSALQLRSDPIVVNSFSKYYSMTGWRLGWMVVPEDLLRPVECLAQNLFISPPTLSQLAAEVAFDCSAQLDEYVAAYARNRQRLLTALPQMGIERIAPADGAFYIYADIGHLTDDSIAFCERKLNETGVATAPGVDFDPERGNRFIRMSFAGPEADIEEAVERLKAWLG